MYTKRVAVLRGGTADEYDLSLIAGAAVIDSLRDAGFFVKDVTISHQGQWILNGIVQEPQYVVSDVDVVFVALNGPYGNDGTVQRILDRYKVPYTGSGAMASNLSLNKYLTKQHLKELGIKMPQHMKLTREGVSDLQQTTFSITQMFGPRYIIKPVNSGSSRNVYYVDDPGTLSIAIASALEASPAILVEEYVGGRNASVNLLESFREQPVYVFPVVENLLGIDSKFISYEQKTSINNQYVCPASFTKAEKQTMEDIAKSVHKLLNLSQYSKTDFIVNPAGIYFLEINSRPHLSKTSPYISAAESVGSSHGEIVKELILRATCTI